MSESTAPGMLSDQAVARYHDQGFLHVPQLLTPAEVAEFLEEGKRHFALEEARTHGPNEGVRTHELDEGLVVEWVNHAGLDNDVLRRLSCHPRIAEVAETLAGGPLRLFKSDLYRKKAESTLTPIHHDEVFFPFSARSALTAWVALVDVPAEKGCLSFIPGSHRVVVPPSADKDPMDALVEAEDPFSRWPELAYQPFVTVPVRAGDVTFHHGRIAHWAGANRTDSTRFSLITIYMDAAATFQATSIHNLLNPDDPDLGGHRPGQQLDGDRFPLIANGG
ncbi:phytanoyl-CoA dioxygenase family protein [Microtetraspora sp. NBRC 13810]|uniref:phytanoyl-CoA dioxygenase family protein n=1 Tax=Microtetraspora sp. NBRC 13810 TaxID=3030990 RepID=UPI00255513E7|nr:phytanoyl-CoA dioxygenase family protein [Microtetraspora sp. NBRC 13810]